MYTMYMSIICIARLNTHVAADNIVGLNKLVVFTCCNYIVGSKINSRIKNNMQKKNRSMLINL